MTILVCEDDLNNRQVFKALLSMMGYSVLAVANSGRLESSRIKSTDADLICFQVDFIGKPFRLSKLRDKIAELIQRASVAVCDRRMRATPEELFGDFPR